MVRLNITIPERLSEKLNHVRNKNRFVSQALREKFQKEEKRKSDRLLIEGYKNSSIEDKSINEDWEKGTLNDGWK